MSKIYNIIWSNMKEGNFVESQIRSLMKNKKFEATRSIFELEAFPATTKMVWMIFTYKNIVASLLDKYKKLDVTLTQICIFLQWRTGETI